MPLGEGLSKQSTGEAYAKARAGEYLAVSDYKGLGNLSWETTGWRVGAREEATGSEQCGSR